MSVAWQGLTEELDRWNAAGLTAGLWWRDDDLTEPGRALEKLLHLGLAHRVPLNLAVIPAAAGGALPSALPHGGVTVFQHGYAHTDHAPSGAGSWELGPHRPRGEIAAELVRGRERLEALFAARFRPVLVPPWSRIDPALLPCLPGLGFTGLSGDGRPLGDAVPGLAVADTELDPIDWKRGGGFKGTRRMIGKIVAALQARRCGSIAAIPLGINTHHIDHDAETWRFLNRLAAAIDQHPAAQWLDATEVFRQQSAYGHQD